VIPELDVPLPDYEEVGWSQRAVSFPLTGKDKGRGDGFDRSRAPLSLPFPSRGKESDYDAAICCYFTLAVGKRKLMNHFVVE
jgi:hypothetical protein